ncbi:transglycosylase domain-containing protein [Gordonia shandongensis]|uniref:transglycosylase domain-containing protein n=1 Tax=Gordonia shandongensis TaxID=376351 RepID=UPI00041E5839|nr:transglycosylase domain-containing protein [Gordonia shandongensis]
MTSDKDAGTGGSTTGNQTAIRASAWGLGLLAGAVPLLALGLVVAFLVTYLTASVPSPGEIKQNQVATIVDDSGKVISRIVQDGGNRSDVKYEDIPTTMVEAVKAAEDRDFDSNSGFSSTGFIRAVMGKVFNREGAGGGSTITQQYVKNAIVGDEVSYKRKFKELAIATKMSQKWSKEDIMAAYLNTIYFGRGAYGIAAAAKTYFDKDITKKTKKNELTVSEAALLAGIIRGPSIYDPAVNRDLAESRWNYVLDGMVDTKAITAAERKEQQFPEPEKVKAEKAATDEGPNGIIKARVRDELNRRGISDDQIRTGGLKITTTIDPKVQKSLVGASRGKLEGEPDDLRTASVAIDPATGAVRGYYGGEYGTGLDYASAALQTGSVFKVFALVAALEQDIPLSSRYSSSPFEATGGITVENSDGESCGTCNLATALKMSLNTVYYRLMMDLNGKADTVADTAHRLGIAESFPGHPHTLQEKNGHTQGGVVLGQYDSRVIDMASAYATLAASGVYREPYFVEKVETSTGDVLYEHSKNDGKRVVPAAVADNVTAAMEPIAAYSNGNVVTDPNLGTRPSAAKTGTAQLGNSGQNRYAWMVGYTPQLSTATWVGTKNGDKPLVNYGGAMIYGSGLPAQIWAQAMSNALAGDEIKQFPNPDPVGGQAGVPYEAPTPTQTEERKPTRTRSRDRGDITFEVPGPWGDITIPGGGGGDRDDGGGETADPGDTAEPTTQGRRGRSPAAESTTEPAAAE